MAEQIKTKAIILSSIRWKESSKIVALFSEKLGKIKVIARSAFRNDNPFAGKLESLTFVDLILFVKENRSLQILKEINIIDPFNTLKKDMHLYPYGLAILELLNQVFEDGHPDEVFFNFIIEMLESLSQIKDPSNILLYLLLKVSSYLGFKPNLQTCLSSNPDLCDETVFLSITDGNIFCKNCGSRGLNNLKLTKKQFFYLKNLQNQNHRRIKNWIDSGSENGQLTQLLLNYINFHLDHDIKIDALALLPIE